MREGKNSIRPLADQINSKIKKLKGDWVTG